jgi:hypothetical protein
MIVKLLNHEWLAEVESETMGFNHLSAKALMTHLCLDHMDVTELISNIQKPWDAIETPAAHFARGDKYGRQLLKVGQAKNPNLRLPSLSRLSKHPENLNLLFVNGKQNPMQIRHL